MPTKDGFSPGHPLPVILADEPEEQGIGKAWDTAVISSLVLKASILAATATAIGIAILSVGNPVMVFADVTASFANVTASLIDNSALKPGTDQSTSTFQSTADAQALPPTAKDAPTRDEIAAAPEPAGQSQAENSEPVTEALFKQFQAWADEKDAQAQVEPVHPVQDAPTQIVQDSLAPVAENARASSRPMQKHRQVRAVHNARAEIRPVHNLRKKVRRARNAPVLVPPAQDARTQEQDRFVQNAQAPALQAPSFLQTFGWRN
ncbi:hypothetical protein [Bradyrhizobium australiense]|uniref:Uncharacterized protein n=1 Tax=Bradyrhizobium australiense TaxID=2721161 RepID=A0A7Y4LX92_9BRAD|nr:hypothetical protein [Bradyrhizobium australiense]NOJ42242.1 hypothetical protein [Bradyrhizobium australiense]